jgi:glycosyltransferase involved in cell wall biosynthesis
VRLLIVSPYFPPQASVASLRVHSFARGWTDLGEQVTVLTTAKRADQVGLDLPGAGFEVVELAYRVPPWLESLRRVRQAEAAPGTNGAPLGARQLLALLRRLRERRGIFASVRMPDLTDHWVRPALAWCRARGPWDVAVSSSGPYTAHLVGLALRRAGLVTTWVADFRDLWTENHIYRGLFPFTWRERAAERACLRSADLLVTVSDGLARRLAARTTRPVKVIPNGFDADALIGLPAESIYPDDGTIRLVHTGTTYPTGQAPDLVIRALARVRELAPALAARLRLTVAGRGSGIWEDLARRSGVGDLVDVRGVVPRGDALRLQRDADGLILLDWSRPDEGVLTGKLFEYLAVTAPILVVGGRSDSSIADVVHRSGRGVHFGDSVDRLARGLLDLAKDATRLAPAPAAPVLDQWRRDRLARECLSLIRAVHRSRTFASPQTSPAPRERLAPGGP